MTRREEERLAKEWERMIELVEAAVADQPDLCGAIDTSGEDQISVGSVRVREIPGVETGIFFSLDTQNFYHLISPELADGSGVEEGVGACSDREAFMHHQAIYRHLGDQEALRELRQHRAFTARHQQGDTSPPA